MPTDQIESLTSEVSSRLDARQMLDSLSVQNADPLKDLIAKDADSDSPFQKVLEWVSSGVYILLLGGLAILIWSMFTE